MSQPWLDICSVEDLVLNSGICALVELQQIAVFSVMQSDTLSVYGLGNYDPFGDANVLYRGILGSTGDTIFVASPLYKQHFCLQTGTCLDNPAYAVPIYPCKILDGRVLLDANAIVKAKSFTYIKTTDSVA